MPTIIFKEQNGFIQGRCIKDCTGLTYKVVNLMQKKFYEGNLVMKLDIKKSFDYINWMFLMQVLKHFGFNDVFTKWIWIILNSANFFISFNGKMHGFFD